jgi:hypothetical protein
MHLVFSVNCVFTTPMVTASNYGRSPSSGFPKLPRDSSRLVLDFISIRRSRKRSLHKLKRTELNSMRTAVQQISPLTTSQHGSSWSTVHCSHFVVSVAWCLATAGRIVACPPSNKKWALSNCKSISSNMYDVQRKSTGERRQIRTWVLSVQCKMPLQLL